MAADLQPIRVRAEMVGVVDGPGRQPEDLALQLGQRLKIDACHAFPLFPLPVLVGHPGWKRLRAPHVPELREAGQHARHIGTQHRRQEDLRHGDPVGLLQGLHLQLARDALAVRLVYAAEDFDSVADLDELVTAQALPAQIREAGRTMGRRLLRIGAPAYPGDWVRRYHEGVEAGTLDAHQALVWGVIAREIGVPVEEAVAAHLYAAVMSLTQNAVRGIPLGQDAGQRVVRRAQEWVLRAVEVSRGLHPDDLGAIAPGLEIAQMRHERQRARMFMS